MLINTKLINNFILRKNYSWYTKSDQQKRWWKWNKKLGIKRKREEGARKAQRSQRRRKWWGGRNQTTRVE